MRSDILNIAIEQLFRARLHLGKKKQYLHKNTIAYILGIRHNISILNIEKILKNLRIIFSAIVEIVSQRGIFFLIGGFNNFVLENIINKFFKKYNLPNNNIYINAITTSKWVNGLFSNWQIIYERIQDLKQIKSKNTIYTNNYLNNLRKIKYLNTKIIPDIVFMFHYDIDAVNEIKNLNIPIIGISDGTNNPNDFLYTLIGNGENFKSINFFCYLIENAFKQGKLEEQEKFLYYFIKKIKTTIIN